MDGVITLTSPDYWVGTRVLIKMLRHTGCKLPVEVWYQGDKPRIDDCDLREITPHGHPIYSLHIRAMLDSQFSRLFYIGSDAYPVVDLTPMFGDLEYPGAIFWREQPNGQAFDPVVYGLPDGTKRTTWNVQGDTKLIDMKQCREAVRTAYHFAINPGIYGPGNFGDQSHFRAAWALHRLPQASYSGNCIDWTAFPFIYLHQGRDGEIAIVHRVGSKWAGKDPTVFAKPMTFHRNLPLEEMAFKYYADSLNYQ